MPDRPSLPSLLTVLALILPSWAMAQTETPPLTAAERAQREAERVFSVIKFHTIRSKPARAPAPPAPRPAQQVRPAPDIAAATSAAAPAAPDTGGDRAPTTGFAAAAAPPAVVQPEEAPAAQPSAQAPEAEPDEAEEEPLRMQSFVAPVLTPAVHATLGAGARHVRVRLTIETDGTVSQAEAVANVPRRLAKPATEAILQWRFAPLAQARTTEVEIAFQRD